MKSYLSFGILTCLAGMLLAQSALAGSLPYTFTPINVPNAQQTVVTDINDAGQIVGGYFSAIGTLNGFVESAGQFTTVDDPNGFESVLTGISNSGETVGQYLVTSNNNTHSFSDNNGSIAGIVFPGAPTTQASGVNSSGLVVGGYTVTGANNLPSNNGFVEFGSNGYLTLNEPGTQSDGLARINDSGQILGQGDLASFLFSNASFSAISYPGASATFAQGLSNNGEVVGFYANGSDLLTHFGFVDENGVFSPFDYPGAKTTELVGVNDNGDIVGNYTTSNGSFAFLATPDAAAPEPGTLLLLATGVIALGLLSRRTRRALA